VADVSMGQVGAVLALEVSRLARSNLDWHRLLELCAPTATLVIDEDGCYGPSDFNDGLLLGLKGTMAQAELHFLRGRSRISGPVPLLRSQGVRDIEVVNNNS
jgi:DNA invertase Pin-like site-specific DNA recombinase